MSHRQLFFISFQLCPLVFGDMAFLENDFSILLRHLSFDKVYTNTFQSKPLPLLKTLSISAQWYCHLSDNSHISLAISSFPTGFDCLFHFRACPATVVIAVAVEAEDYNMNKCVQTSHRQPIARMPRPTLTTPDQ